MKKLKTFLIMLCFSITIFISSCSNGSDHTHSYAYKNDESNHWQECSCGEKQNEENHVFGDWTTIKEPTINSAGSKKRLCEICQYEQIEALDPKEPEETKGLEYSLNNNKKSYTVVGIGSATDETELVIPSTYQNLPVEQIAKDCFANNKNLKSVTLSKNIIYIDSRGFSNCSNIESVYYLGTLEDWCKITFQSITSNPIYPKSSLYLRNQSGTLEKIDKLDIPNGVKEIKSFAFPRLQDLTDVILPEGIQKIGQCAFYECPKLSYIELPKSLTLIRDDAFSIDCEDGYYENEPSILRTIKFNGTLEQYCNIEIWNIYASPLQNAKTVYMLDESGKSMEIKTLEIPGSITEVKEYLFFGWSELTEVVLPASIRSIKSDAFEKCLNLERIYYKGDKASWQKVSIEFNREITDEKLYYYSNSKPIQSGNYWHYTNDKIILWEKVQEEQHNYSTEWTVDQEATCTENGSKSHHCLDCKEKKDITVIPALGHMLPENYFYDSIEHWKKCERCHSIVDKISHSYNQTGACNICLYNPTVGTEGLEYTLNEDEQSYSVTGIGTATSCNIIIPNFYKDLPVTSIGANAFEQCENIANVIIGDNVSYISSEAFKLCVNMTEVILPNDVKYIDYAAFSMCYSLENLTIPDSVIGIGPYAFSYCMSLTCVTFLGNVESIWYSAFHCCYKLVEIYNLSSMNIEMGSMDNGGVAFFAKVIHNRNEPSNLFEVSGNWYIEDENKEYTLVTCNAFYKENEEDVVFPLAYGKFYSIGSAAMVPYPVPTTGEGVTKPYHLESITIPTSIKRIGMAAFASCNITNVYYEGTIEDWCNISFAENSSNPMWSAGHFYLRNSNNEWEEVTSIEIPNKITEIGDYQFSGFSNIISISIPESVTSIGNYAFSNCSSLKSLTIPDSVTNIENSNLFEGCNNLICVSGNSDIIYKLGYSLSSVAQVIITGGESIVEWCFGNGNGRTLTDITISNSVTSIGTAAFYECDNLINVYYDGSVEDWCKISFMSGGNPMNYASHFYLRNSNNEWEEVTSIEIPNTITEIGNYQFSGFSNIISISIPESVTSIGNSAFYRCSKLTSIAIPNEVSRIDTYAFAECSSLTSIVIPNEVSRIDTYAFARCSGLTSIVIPESVTSIGNYAFYECSNLTRIEIPGSVTSIGAGAFYECSKLTDVYYGGTVEDWKKITIDSDNSYFNNATRYYYSKTQPSETGHYWYYVNGIPTKW